MKIGTRVYVAFAGEFGTIYGIEEDMDITGDTVYNIRLDSGRKCDAYPSQIS